MPQDNQSNSGPPKAPLQPWNELTELTQGRSFYIERARMLDTSVALEGRFEVPELAKLSPSDQTFVVAFVKTEGSIKEMERLFGVSYPSIKSRLTKISKQLNFVENLETESTEPPVTLSVLEQISAGTLSVQEGIKILKKEKKS